MTHPAITIGLDVSDRTSRLCVLDADGEVLEESRLRTTPGALRHRFEAMASARVVLEVGTHSAWIERLLRDLGHDVIVANARRLRFIYENETKSDPVDAEALARVGRLDPALLAPIQHRGVEAQADLALIRSRDALVRARSRLVSHARGLTKSVGARLPRCSAAAFHHKVAGSVPAELAPALLPVLDTVGELTGRIRALDREIERVATERYPETACLTQVHGVGTLTALAFVLTLEDPDRFETSRSVGAYLGLVPRRADSGERSPELRITGTGDELLRRLLVQCAQFILGPLGQDSDLRRKGLALAGRGGKAAKKRAVVAIARKLAVVLHRLWVSGEAYEPLREAQRRERREAAAVA